jgi:hypothetical protein
MTARTYLSIDVLLSANRGRCSLCKKHRDCNCPKVRIVIVRQMFSQYRLNHRSRASTPSDTDAE